MPPVSAPLTHRQGEYLAYYDADTRRYGRPPSEAEMAAHVTVSAPAVHHMVETLAQRGLVARAPGEARSLRVVLPPEALPHPEAGRGRASEPPPFAATYLDLPGAGARRRGTDLGRPRALRECG